MPRCITYETVRKNEIAEKIDGLTPTQLVNLIYQYDSGDIATIEDYFQNECSVKN